MAYGSLSVLVLLFRSTHLAPIEPTLEDLEWVAHTYAHHFRVFAELCAFRWALNESICEQRWSRWQSMRAREVARQRMRQFGTRDNEWPQPIRVREPSNASGGVGSVSYRPLRFGPQYEANTKCTADGDGSASSGPVLALGIVSACHIELPRHAMRHTWLRSARNEAIEFRFIVAVPENGELPSSLLREMATHRDMQVMNWTESYTSTVHKVIAIFVWGTRQCSAFYVARANDDVYLRLQPTMNVLFAAGPPSRLYAGLFIDGAHMTVPRLEALTVPHGADRDEWLSSVKAWTVSREDYPADIYPTFAQGNAYVLSRDLAEALAAFAERPWIRMNLPDDVLTGLVVDSVTGGRPRRVDIHADYELEGHWTRCSDAALWHFNIHHEHMYDLHFAAPTTVMSYIQVTLDGSTLTLEFDREVDDVSALSHEFANAHASLTGAGCSKGDSVCLSSKLERAMRSAPAMKNLAASQCSRIPDRVFCCG